MFDVKRFHNELTTSWLGKEFRFFEAIDSTNNYVRELEPSMTPHGFVCLADYQTGGRGQYERKWLSNPGVNLMFSIVFKPPIVDRLFSLSMLSACAICEVFEEYIPFQFDIKWPNDIYCKGKKLGGLLTETVFEGSTLERIVIGIGLNINQKNFEQELATKATSLYNLHHLQEFDREELMTSILDRIEQFYNLWLDEDNSLIKKINNRIIGYGRDVILTVDGKKSNELYKLLGINRNGHLMALSQDLDVLTFKYEQVRVEDVI